MKFTHKDAKFSTIGIVPLSSTAPEPDQKEIDMVSKLLINAKCIKSNNLRMSSKEFTKIFSEYLHVSLSHGAVLAAFHKNCFCITYYNSFRCYFNISTSSINKLISLTKNK